MLGATDALIERGAALLREAHPRSTPGFGLCVARLFSRAACGPPGAMTAVAKMLGRPLDSAGWEGRSQPWGRQQASGPSLTSRSVVVLGLEGGFRVRFMPGSE